MRRRQLVEIEDLAWCPRAVRDGGTDWLGFMANTTGMFDAVAPKIREAMRVTGTETVVDLCSGGGGPWLTLQRELAKTGPVQVCLSDLYPNLAAFAALRVRSHDRLHYLATSVDATNVPAELSGVRTMFNVYLVDELHELVSTVPGHERFHWDIGTTRLFGPLGPLHLIGVPQPDGSACPVRREAIRRAAPRRARPA